MLNWLAGNWGSLVAGLAIVSVVAMAVRKMILDKKQHKSACGCSCEGCPSAGLCHPKQ